MNSRNEKQSFVSAIMEAAGLGPRKRLAPRAARFLGINGSIGNGRVRHCSTWDLDYQLPRVARSSFKNDFDLR